MIKIDIENLEQQELEVAISNKNYSLTIYYKPTIQQWFLDIKGIQNGIRLVCGVLLLDKIKPFNMIVVNNTETGIDPNYYDDFDYKYELLVFEREEIKKIRGFDAQ